RRRRRSAIRPARRRIAAAPDRGVGQRRLRLASSTGGSSRLRNRPSSGCVERSSRSLALSTCNPVLGFRLDRSAGVTQVAPRLFAYRTACVLGKADQRLTGRATAAFKGPVIGVEGG